LIVSFSLVFEGDRSVFVFTTTKRPKNMAYYTSMLAMSGFERSRIHEIWSLYLYLLFSLHSRKADLLHRRRPPSFLKRRRMSGNDGRWRISGSGSTWAGTGSAPALMTLFLFLIDFCRQALSTASVNCD